MSNQFSEDDVFSSLGITDFSEISSQNFIKFASVFNELDPECQIKAIESIPSFAETAKEAILSYKDVFTTTCSNNSASIDNYYSGCHKIIDSLNSLLANDELTFDEKKTVIDYIMIIERHMAAKDTENKEFLKHESDKTRSGIWAIVTGMVVIVFSVLSVKIGTGRSSNRS